MSGTSLAIEGPSVLDLRVLLVSGACAAVDVAARERAAPVPLADLGHPTEVRLTPGAEPGKSKGDSLRQSAIR